MHSTQPSIITDNQSVDDGDSSGEAASGSASSVFLPMPFENDSQVDESIFPTLFWSSSDFNRINWLSDRSIQWGKWVYDPRTKTLRHSLTHRTFSLNKINDPTRLLKVLASLLVQPHSDTEQFYQLASGVLKNRHGTDWNSFWQLGDATFLKTISKPNTPKPPNSHG